ncbi:MAG: hypothetical protein JO316_03780 [Abitibacteriaceae bacterium]|nr:hypothetical protein [Abditibacteriaceae bacterium]
MQSGPTLNADILNNNWIDFYALLDVAPDADETAIRKRISARYSEASTNYNHRDLQRREYYQLLGQQVIPQCRRILLNPEFREWYDCQNSLHQAGDANALDYRTFLVSLNEDGIAPASADAPAIVDTLATPAIPVAAVAASEATEDKAPELVSVESTEAAPAVAEFTPAEVATPEPVATTPVAAAPIEAVAPAPKQDFIAETTPLQEPMPVIAPSPGVEAESPAKKSSLRPAAPTGPTTFIQDNLAAPHAVGKAVKQAVKEDKKRKKAARQENSYKPRVAIGDAMATQSVALAQSSGLFRPGERALSDTSIALLTAIVAMMLSITIDYFSIPGLAQWTGIGLAITQSPRIREFVPSTMPSHSTPHSPKQNQHLTTK